MNDWDDPAHHITELAGLRALYGEPAVTATSKVADHVHPLYRPFIEAAPFAVLATSGPRGLDTSPRGDAPGFVRIADAKTLLLPDRRGNNRIDSLGNVLHDPRVALMFLVPGCREALRVNGTARISVAPALLQQFEVDGKLPRSVLVVRVHSVFFQCGRALMRSQLWDPKVQVDRGTLPTVGTVLQALSGGEVDGAAYDAELPSRQALTLY